MELFTILCTTCKSRLKVRDEAAIGQILACPKCGGMVMVKPPPSWSDGQEAPSELPTVAEASAIQRPIRQTAGSSAFDAVDELLSDSPPKINPPSSAAQEPALPRPRFVGGPPPGNSEPPVSDVAKTVPFPTKIATSSAPPADSLPKPAPKTTATPTERSSALPPPPPGEVANIQSADAAEVARPWRFWLLLAGSVVAGIALALGAVMTAIHLYPRSATQTSKRPVTAPETAPAPEAAPVANSKPPGEIEAPANLAVVKPEENTAPATSPSTAATPVVSPTPPAAEGDPLGLIQEPKVAAKATPANDQLAKFDRLISGDDPPPKTTGPSSAPSANPTAIADPAANRPGAPRPQPREVSVSKRLADPLQAIETAGTPLADFLQLISDLSTIPLTLEPDALAFLQKTADMPVFLKAANTTVGDALTQGLLPLGLEAVEMDKQLVVRPIEPPALLKIPYPMRGLATTEESLAELAGLLQALVEPGSWAKGQGQGAIAIDADKKVLSIRQRKSVHASLVFLCEKIRIARGQPPASSKFDPALFKLDSRWDKAKPKLDAPLSLNYAQPTRLVTILERLGAAGGVRILIDWHDVAAAGWNPDGEAILLANQQPLAAALDALLNPLDLSWRVVDGQTLQVVTPARLAERPEVELYKVENLLTGDATGEALLAKVRDALGTAVFRDGGGNGELRFDAEGKCLLAALPQPRQRELETLLSTWRSPGAKK